MDVEVTSNGKTQTYIWLKGTKHGLRKRQCRSTVNKKIKLNKLHVTEGKRNNEGRPASNSTSLEGNDSYEGQVQPGPTLA